MSRKKVAAAAYSIGIDTGKNVLHVIGLDEKGAVVLREKVSRSRIAARLVNVPRCLIGIEAGMATHCMAASWLRSATRSSRCRRLMPSRFDKATRMIFGTPTQSRKLCNGLRLAVFQLRRTINWTCRHYIECVLA